MLKGLLIMGIQFSLEQYIDKRIIYYKLMYNLKLRLFHRVGIMNTV